jgi:SAM-dependent methyltransferase/uncharacterized protein YbaR (Trm112 family)
MKERLLGFLVCLHCKGKLSLKILEEKEYEIVNAILLCARCSRSYPVIDGVPRMLSAGLLAAILPQKLTAWCRKYKQPLPKVPAMIEEQQIKKTTVESFAYEWKNFSTVYSSYEQQFLDWIYPVKKDFFRQKLVLDAGCGNGRHVIQSTKFEAEVIGIDLGGSVDVAYRNTKNIDRAHIVQADLCDLPFRYQAFDYIYSIGVLHHLPYPQKGFEELLKHVRRKGAISVWVYGREGNSLLVLFDPIRRKVLSRLPIRINKLSSLCVAALLYPLLKLVYKPCNQHKGLLFLTQYLPQNAFFYYLAKLNFRIVHSIIFDQFLAPIAHYLTKDDLRNWFNQRRLVNITITQRNNNSWRGFAIKV